MTPMSCTRVFRPPECFLGGIRGGNTRAEVADA